MYTCKSILGLKLLLERHTHSLKGVGLASDEPGQTQMQHPWCLPKWRPGGNTWEGFTSNLYDSYSCLRGKKTLRHVLPSTIFSVRFSVTTVILCFFVVQHFVLGHTVANDLQLR